MQKPPAIDQVSKNIPQLLAVAKMNRPDLLAAEAKVRQSQAQLAATKASAYPTLSITATTAQGVFSVTPRAPLTTAALTLSFPLFTGFSYTYSVKQAEAQTESAAATRDQLNQQIQLQVWQAYFALQTAEKNIDTTEALLKSSLQASEQALGQYKNGVGDILSVLTTQTTLANARVQVIQAKLNWYIALAQFASAIGSLDPSSVRDLTYEKKNLTRLILFILIIVAICVVYLGVHQTRKYHRKRDQGRTGCSGEDRTSSNKRHAGDHSRISQRRS